MSDAGERCLRDMYQRLQIDEQWTVRSPRAFRWVGWHLAQAVTATPMFTSFDTKVSRVESKVVVVENVTAPASHVLATLSAVNSGAVASAYCFDEAAGSVFASFGHCVHDQTVGFRAGEMASYQILQLLQAETIGPALADACGGRLAQWSHPEAGPRTTPDEMLRVGEQLYLPRGMRDSDFARNDEFEAVYAHCRQTFHFSAGGSQDGIAIEVAYGPEHTSLVQLSARAPHPSLGNGLAATILLPPNVHPLEGARAANAMNIAQVNSGGGPGFGAWCTRQHGDSWHVAHERFVPNANYMPGLVLDVAMSSIRHALWADERAWPDLARPRSVMPALIKRDGLSEH